MSARYLRDVAAMCEAAGVTVLRTQTGRNHDRLWFRAADGNERFYVLARSPGDWRAPRKALADIVRMAGVRPADREPPMPRKERRAHRARGEPPQPGTARGMDSRRSLAEQLERWSTGVTYETRVSDVTEEMAAMSYDHVGILE